MSVEIVVVEMGNECCDCVRCQIVRWAREDVGADVEPGTFGLYTDGEFGLAMERFQILVKLSEMPPSVMKAWLECDERKGLLEKLAITDCSQKIILESKRQLIATIIANIEKILQYRDCLVQKEAELVSFVFPQEGTQLNTFLNDVFRSYMGRHLTELSAVSSLIKEGKIKEDVQKINTMVGAFMTADIPQKLSMLVGADDFRDVFRGICAQTSMLLRKFIDIVIASKDNLVAKIEFLEGEMAKIDVEISELSE